MDILITIVTATIVLGFLVFIHEGGHFLAARAFGVRVSEFMIGLPGPRIGFTWAGTRFGITAIPLGGYASICGMAPHFEHDKTKDILIYTYRNGSVSLDEVMNTFGMNEDDAFSALEELCDWGSLERPTRKDSVNIYRTPATKTDPLGSQRYIEDPEAFYDHERSLQYFMLPFWKRSIILLAGPFMNLLFTIVAFIIIYSIIGLDLQNTQTGEITHVTYNPIESIGAGFRLIGMTLVAIAGLFNPETAAQTISNSTSIVGIAIMSKGAFEAGLINFLFFAAVISVSLGLMNLLPIPPLDGGRFVVEVFQKISKKTVSIKALNYMSLAGMVLFGVFFLVMLNQDVQRYIFGNW